MKILLKYQERVWYNKNKASPKGEGLEKIRRNLMTNTQELYTRWLSQPDLDDAIKAELVSVAGDDDAIALDTDLTADLETLRSFTEQTASVAAEATSFEEFSSKLLDQPGVNDAGPAGIRLNTFAQQTCGFSTTSNGG